MQRAVRAAKIRAAEMPDAVTKGAGKQPFSWYIRWLIERDRARLEREGKL